MTTPVVVASLVLVAAILGGRATSSSVADWYPTLHKPSWTPPSWAFGAAWTPLYVAIAVAGVLVWDRDGFGLAMVLWGVQLALNALWSAIFFGLRAPALALLEIGLLGAAVAACIVMFAPISALAAWLFVPYLAWVLFAGLLNYRIWQLNEPV